MEFDPWQQEIIDHEGSLTLVSGRQVGKSTTVGRRRAKLMLEYPGSISLIIAPAQRQSSQLFIKTMSWLQIEHTKAIEAAGGFKPDPQVSQRRNMELRRLFEHKHGIFAEQPTKTLVTLKTGSMCWSLPAGKTGTYLRTFALDFLDVDEAAYVPEPVYTAIKPMLAVAAKKGLGWETFLSTPFGTGGFFHDACESEDYKHFYKSSEDCDRIPKEFLLKERKRLSKREYAQEWQGKFVDEFHQLFPTALVKKRMTFMRWSHAEDYKHGKKYYLGVDLAGPGKDENAFVIAEMDGKKVKIVKAEVDEEKNTLKTRYKIERFDKGFHFAKIFIDSGGFGYGITEEVKRTLGKMRVVGLDNSKKTIDKDGRKGKILKEDLYSNASSLMEQENKIDIINSERLLRSLKSMTFEYTEHKNLKIFGKYSHLSEAFVRACWCVKERGLDIYIL